MAKYKNLSSSFGSLIRKTRLKLGIGQRELAKKVGIAASYLNDIEKYTVPLALRGFISAEDLSFYGESFAMSILSLIPVFIFFIIFQRFIIHGIAMSGIKG